jgi:hypothetical protein
MEMMEADIDRLSEFSVDDTFDITSPDPPIQTPNHNRSRTWLLDQQVRNIQDQFSRDQEVRYNSFLKERIEVDLDTMNRVDIAKKDDKDQRFYTRAERSYSPSRRGSPARLMQSSAEETAKQVNSSKAKKPVNTQKGHPKPNSKPASKEEIPPKRQAPTLRPAGTDGSYGSENNFISVQDHRGQGSAVESLPFKGIGSSVKEQKPEPFDKPQRADCNSNQSKRSNFLKSNKYSHQERNAIMEESSDNPFDKFEKNAQAREVASSETGERRPHTLPDEFCRENEHAAEHPHRHPQLPDEYYRHLPVEGRHSKRAHR